MRRVVFASALAVAGCGLIGNDLTTVTVSLPARDFRVDSADWRLPAAPTIPPFECSSDCTVLADQICTQQNCTTECGSDLMCQANIPVSLKNDFDLSSEPSYQQVANLPAVEVQLQSVAFNITENTLNLDTPALQVYFGPTSITAPTDAAAELVGTIPSVPAGQTGIRAVMFSANGQAVVKKYMDDYRTPFRVLVYSTVVVHGGQDTPGGRLVGQVTATATVGLSL